MDKAVTINDIVRETGVGKGTVDRVLHNRGRVSEETRQRVLQCIEELGYKPNKAARMLAKRNIFKIAVIYHNKEKEFWRQVEEGIDKAEQEYKQMGVIIDRFVLPQISVEGQLEMIHHVIGENYDGMAIVPYCSEKITEAIDLAVEKGMQVVTFNNDEPCKRSCYVGQDLRQSGRTAGKLMSMIAPFGCTYAIVLPVIESMSALYGRYQGFQEVLSEKRRDMKLVGVYNFKQDGEQAYSKVQELLKEKELGALYVSNVILEDVARAVSDAALGDRIVLIGHDLTETIVNYIKEGVVDVSIGQEPEKQGYVAIEKICRKLLADEEIEQDVFTKIEVVVSENLAYV